MGIFRRFLRDIGILRDQSVTVRDELTVSVIHDLAQKERRRPEEIADELLAEAVEQRNQHEINQNLWDILSYREQQVVALAVLGYTNPQIAITLNLSISTVKTYITNAFYKLNVRSRNELSLKFKGWDFETWAKNNIANT